MKSKRVSHRGTAGGRSGEETCTDSISVSSSLEGLVYMKYASSQGEPGETCRNDQVTRLYEPFTFSFKSIVKSQPNYGKLSIFNGTEKPCGFIPHNTALWGQFYNAQVEQVTALVIGSKGHQPELFPVTCHNDPQET